MYLQRSWALIPYGHGMLSLARPQTRDIFEQIFPSVSTAILELISLKHLMERTQEMNFRVRCNLIFLSFEAT